MPCMCCVFQAMMTLASSDSALEIAAICSVVRPRLAPWTVAPTAHGPGRHVGRDSNLPSWQDCFTPAGSSGGQSRVVLARSGRMVCRVAVGSIIGTESEAVESVPNVMFNERDI
jgi:hypothetical protein